VTAAAFFDGSGSGRIVIPDSQKLNPRHITIEALIRLVRRHLDPHQQRILEKSFDRAHSFWPTYALASCRTEARASELVIIGNDDPVFVTGKRQSYTPNVATHLAATYDGNTIEIYVNGVLDVSLAVAGEILSTFGSSDIGIGRRRSSCDRAFNGVIDEVAVYDSALSADRIRSHFANLADGDLP